MARPGRDVYVARRAAGYKRVQLSRLLTSVADGRVGRLERGIQALPDLARANELIALLPTLPLRAQFLLRTLVRRDDGPHTAVLLPGTAGNYVSTPDQAGFATNDLDFRIHVLMDDWSPAAFTVLGAQYGTAANSKAWRLGINPSGTIGVAFSEDGTTDIFSGSVNPGFTDGTDHWLRLTRVKLTAAWTAWVGDPGGRAWTALQTGTAGTPTTALFDATSVLTLGASAAAGSLLAGRVLYAEFLSGIDGSVVAKYDPSVSAAISAVRTPTSFVSATGETWTMNGAGWSWVQAD